MSIITSVLYSILSVMVAVLVFAIVYEVITIFTKNKLNPEKNKRFYTAIILATITECAVFAGFFIGGLYLCLSR